MPDYEIFDDGWMFLTGGTNQVCEYFLEGKRIGEPVLRAWRQVLSNRAELAEKLGFRFIHIVGPEKLSVYPDKTTYDIDDSNLPATQVAGALDSAVAENHWLNPTNYLRKQSEQFLTYSKTDTHWNFVGAFCAYQLLQHRLGLPIRDDLPGVRAKGNWCTMDLGGKLDPPLQEQVFFHTLGGTVERTFANEIVQFKEQNGRLNDPGLHRGSFVSFRNSEPVVDQRLLLFGDSFSEYRGHLLTGLLAETYREVSFVWSAGLDHQLIEQLAPDVVVSQQAERFMSTRAPVDDFDHALYCEQTMVELADQANTPCAHNLATDNTAPEKT